MLLDLLSIQELRGYGLICKSTYLVVKRYLEKNSSLRRVLTRYIREESVPMFRAMQRATGALIGGSAALQFFTRLHFTKSDLDVYVHRLYTKAAVGALKKMRCLRVAKRSLTRRNSKTKNTVGHYMDGGIDRVLNFMTPTRRKLQLIVTNRRPVEVILGYHSSEFNSAGVTTTSNSE